MSQQPLVSINRRKFLKGLGLTSAVSVAACASDQTQNIYSFVRGENEQVPGVAQWFSSTCTECTAGCGIQVRTREGRAVKVEGDPRNPINRGGLCALGQASLQHLYDPDRVREPLKRVSGVGETAKFEPISWDEALSQIVAALKEPLAEGKKRALVTGEVSGALAELVSEWTESFGASHVVYDVMQPVALARASELVFGSYGVPDYAIDKAEVIVNFGADFLETWVSPCQFARQWADSRRSAKPVRVIQVEPRLSLTGANADQWIMNNPGSDVRIALALLRSAVVAGRGRNLSADVRDLIDQMVKGVSTGSAAAEAGISEEAIASMSHRLLNAKQSLVLAGGAGASTSDAIALHVVCHLLNVVLENVGSTVLIDRMRTPRTSMDAVQSIVEDMAAGQVSLACVYETNPAFTLPSDYGFEYALRNVPLVVSFSSHLDETAKNANLILPTNTGLEVWGDIRSYRGAYGLVQPAMTAVFNTKPVGDVLITLAKQAGKAVSGATITPAVSPGGEIPDFKSYLQLSWRALHQSNQVAKSFESFWAESVERGGYFPEGSDASIARIAERPRVRVDRGLFALSFAASAIGAGAADKSSDKATEQGKAAEKGKASGAKKSKELVVFPYPSVKSFDGRAANRPWLQELPDPITQVVWDSWGELHPETAKAIGVEQGDLLTVRNRYGEVNVPVLVTPYVNKGMVAVPMGQGHTSYGRFAQVVTTGNVLELIGKPAQKGAPVALVSARAEAFKAPGRAKLVKTQGSDSQHDRDLGRTRLIKEGPNGALLTTGHKAPDHSHDIKQMYEQREHPLYQWGMTIDLAACTGCSACVVACYAENNIPVVGKSRAYEGREMSWLRIERYYDNATFDNRSDLPAPEELSVSFVPMMCQHCHNAPCEPVCPVYATYHNEEGMNAMVYNRCVGTRYCSNNCSYKVRRFNWYDYEFPDTLQWQLNPDVTKRTVGIMEKCTFCVQRIAEAKDSAKDQGRAVRDGEVQPACVQSCPTQALTFGNMKDPQSAVNKARDTDRTYKVLDYYINTQPAVSYLERLRYAKT